MQYIYQMFVVFFLFKKMILNKDEYLGYHFTAKILMICHFATLISLDVPIWNDTHKSQTLESES